VCAARLPPLQDLLGEDGTLGTDASGNPILKDIGMYLKDKLKGFMKDAVGRGRGQEGAGTAEGPGCGVASTIAVGN
jgi:hypothetical protein